MFNSRKQKMNFYFFNPNKNKGGRMSLKKIMNAGFKTILNFKHKIEREKIDNQKSSSKLSAALLALILGASVFMAGQVWAAKYVTDPHHRQGGDRTRVWRDNNLRCQGSAYES